MSAFSNTVGTKSPGIALILGLTLLVGVRVVPAADELSAQQIIDALKPPRFTRGLIYPVTRIENQVHVTCDQPPRSLTAYGALDAMIKDRPNVDLEINFEYNSDRIGPAATSQIASFGQALTSSDLLSSTFLLAGHTDAKGSAAYNLDLSKRRAVALMRYLSDTYKIEAGKLMPCGYGKAGPKNPSNPFAAENRRVQVVNLFTKAGG